MFLHFRDTKNCKKAVLSFNILGYICCLMNFVYPEFLYGLFALAIPIIIHLFNFRKFKRVYFTNVRFLKEVQQETQSRSQLKHLLVLLLRMLAVAALVLAFAQPYVPSDEQSVVVGRKAVSVYLDNSFSMDGENKNGRLFEQAKAQIVDLVNNNYSPTDQFQLLTNDFEGRHQRLVNREEFLELLEEVQLTPKVRVLSEVQARQADILSTTDAGSKEAFWATDLQKSVLDIEQLKQDSIIQTQVLPFLASAPRNLYIDSIWFSSPVRQLNAQESLNVRVVNTGQEPLDVPIKLKVNGAAQGLANFTVDAASSVDTVITFTNTTPGIQNGEIYVEDYPITFDDRFFFSYEVADKISVLLIDEGSLLDSSAVKPYSFFLNDPFYNFSITSSSAIDYSSLALHQLIILNELPTFSSGLQQELQKFVSNGGSLVVFPGEEIDLNSYNELLLGVKADRFVKLDTSDHKVASIELQHPIYQGVFENIPENIDLPNSLKHYVISNSVTSSQERLLRLQNGDAFLSAYPSGKGKVYVAAVGLNSSFGNLSRHAIYVASMLRIAEFSMPSNQLYYTIGQDEVIELSNFTTSSEHTFRIVNEEEEYDFILEHRNVGGKTSVFLQENIEKAGNYLLRYHESPVSGLGLNYQRIESKMEAFTVEEVLEESERLGLTNLNVIEGTSSGEAIDLSQLKETKLWKYFILLVLLFLGLEILVLRLWRN